MSEPEYSESREAVDQEKVYSSLPCFADWDDPNLVDEVYVYRKVGGTRQLLGSAAPDITPLELLRLYKYGSIYLELRGKKKNKSNQILGATTIELGDEPEPVTQNENLSDLLKIMQDNQRAAISDVRNSAQFSTETAVSQALSFQKTNSEMLLALAAKPQPALDSALLLALIEKNNKSFDWEKAAGAAATVLGIAVPVIEGYMASRREKSIMERVLDTVKSLQESGVISALLGFEGLEGFEQQELAESGTEKQLPIVAMRASEIG